MPKSGASLPGHSFFFLFLFLFPFFFLALLFIFPILIDLKQPILLDMYPSTLTSQHVRVGHQNLTLPQL